MPRLIKPRGVSWKTIARRTWTKADTDDVLGRSAQLAYYFFLALFPMLIFLVSVLGIFPGAAEHVRSGLYQFLSQTLPASASELVEKTMNEVIYASGLGKPTFGLIISLWSASAGMLAIMDTLNAEHGVVEDRSFFRQRTIAIGLTLAVATLMACAVAVVLIRESEGFSGLFLGGFPLAWKVIQWPVALACVLFGLALIYYFAPNLKRPEWHWITPGAMVGCLLWLLAS